MKPVVLVGHSHTCPTHGKNAVETGSPNYTWRFRVIVLTMTGIWRKAMLAGNLNDQPGLT